MFLPIGDTPNPRNFRPWMNWALIATNVVVYVLVTLPLSFTAVDPEDPALAEYLRVVLQDVPWWMTPRAAHEVLDTLTAYDLFAFGHGYKPGAPEWSDLLTCMFLHGGFAHLAGNMLFLWIFGDNVEHRLGRLGYLATYLLTGIVATWTFSWFAGDSMVPLVGASGAISGVIGLYYLLFPRNRVRTFVFLFPFVMDVWLIPVRWVLGFYVLADNLLPFVLGAESGVAYGAHLGGFVAGLGMAWGGERLAWRWPWAERGWRTRFERPAGAIGGGRVGQDGAVGTGPLAPLRAALREGDRTRAIAEVAGLDRAALAGLTPPEVATLATWLDDLGYPAAATRLLRQYLVDHPRSRDLARIYLALGLLRLKQGQQAAAYQYLLSVFDLDPDPDTADLAREALRRLDLDRRALRTP